MRVIASEVDGYAWCTRKWRDEDGDEMGFCEGNAQRPVRLVREEVEWTFLDNGGDHPGVERSAVYFRFADEGDIPCPVCGETRSCSDQARLTYDNASGQSPDEIFRARKREKQQVTLAERQAVALEALVTQGQSDAKVAQLEALVMRQSAELERLGEMLNGAPPARKPKAQT
jgi:uncharacterized Zn finger protein (UPF0148 family)